MKKSEMINYLKENIKINAYRATICEWLADLCFDVCMIMMEYYKNIDYGTTYAFIETLATIMDEHDESAYEGAVNEADNDIKNAN